MITVRSLSRDDLHGNQQPITIDGITVWESRMRRPAR